MQIVSSVKFRDLVNSPDSFYIKDLNYKISYQSGFDSYSFTDLTNALKSGLECITYTVKANDIAFIDALPVTNLINKVTLNDFIFYLKSLEFPHGKWGFDSLRDSKRIYYKSTERSTRVYSPFNQSLVKPLKTMPKKWTLTHVKKALLNGQFKDLKCKGVYTDDYAYDAAYNYQEGEISNAISFVKKIIENPSGWWTSFYNGIVSIDCHTFDLNEFKPVIN